MRILHWKWVILFSAFYTNFVSYGIRFSFGMLLPVMTSSLSLTAAQAGLIVGVYFICYTAFSPVAGALTDRIGARKVITLFCVVLGIGTTLMGTITGQSNAFLFYAMVGIGASACWTPVVALVQRWFPPRRKGAVLGIVTTGYAFGYGTLGLMIPIWVSTYGWRTCWYILGAMACSLIAINAILLRDNPEERNSKTRNSEPVTKTQKTPSAPVRAPSRTGYSEIVGASKFWLIGASYSMIAAAAYILTTFLVSFATFELRMRYEDAVPLVSLLAFAGVPGALVLSTLSDYAGRRNALVLCNVLMMVSLAGLVSIGRTVPVLLPIVSIYGFSNGGIWPIYAACTSEYFPKALSGSVLGFWTVFYGIGATMGPAVAGYMADLSKTFFWSFVLAALLAAGSVILLLLVQKRK